MLSLPSLHMSVAQRAQRARWMGPLPANALHRTARAEVIKAMLARGEVAAADVVAALRDGDSAAWERLREARVRQLSAWRFSGLAAVESNTDEPAAGQRGGALELARALSAELAAMPASAVGPGRAVAAIRAALAQRTEKIGATLPDTLREGSNAYELTVGLCATSDDGLAMGPGARNLLSIPIELDLTTAAGRAGIGRIREALGKVSDLVPWAGLRVEATPDETDAFSLLEGVMDLWVQTRGLPLSEAAFDDAQEDTYIPSGYDETLRMFAELDAIEADEAAGDPALAPGVEAAIAAFERDCAALAGWLGQWKGVDGFDEVCNINEDGERTWLSFDALPRTWSQVIARCRCESANEMGLSEPLRRPRGGAPWDSDRVDAIVAATVALNALAGAMIRASKEIEACGG